MVGLKPVGASKGNGECPVPNCFPGTTTDGTCGSNRVCGDWAGGSCRQFAQDQVLILLTYPKVAVLPVNVALERRSAALVVKMVGVPVEGRHRMELVAHRMGIPTVECGEMDHVRAIVTLTSPFLLIPPRLFRKWCLRI